MTEKLKPNSLFLPALILSIAISIPMYFIRYYQGFAFEIALQSSANSSAQLFYDLTGNGFREQDSVKVLVSKSDNLVTYQPFPL